MVRETNAKIIYYHITKAFNLSVVIMVFKQLIYTAYKGSIFVGKNVLIEEFSQHGICQAENILVYIVVLTLIDLSYYKKDSSINMGINR